MSYGGVQILNRFVNNVKTVGAAWRFAQDMSSGHTPNAVDLRELGIDGSNLQFAAQPREIVPEMPQRSASRRTPVSAHRGIKGAALAG